MAREFAYTTLTSILSHERGLFVLTRLEFNGRIDADHSLQSPEQIHGGRACTAVMDPLSERASSNIALLYGGILSETPKGGWPTPQRAWST
jgi:hypothetical protein